MDFWNTILGHHLADTLIRHLPKLAEALATTQYTIECESKDKAAAIVKDSINNGHKYVSQIDESDGKVLLIMQK